MRGEFVAIDLETTGLDPSNDAIIEIGISRMDDGKVVHEFSTLVNPGIPIPTHVTHITGIRTEDVANAPGIATLLPKIQEYVGDATIVGHNIAFDIAFFKPHGILQENHRIDTYDLASILLPRAPRYNLNSLTTEMGIELQNAHRALDDARASAFLYWELWKKMLTLPPETLQEIVAASYGMSWDSAVVFELALREIEAQVDISAPRKANIHSLFSPIDFSEKALRPVENITPLNETEIAASLGEGGALSKTIENYEYRPQQLEMATAVVSAFNHKKHAIIEAGTGTGKSLAYLIPAVEWAVKNGERVVVSTNTINLQEQLINNDVPLVADALGMPFKACIMKGRSNYLCPRRLEAIRRRKPTNLDELRTLAKILVWLLESSTGDKSEISLRGPVEHSTWERLSAQDEGCTLQRCSTTMAGACPFYKARKAADAAHVVIVNHALLVSDAMSENTVLPDYRYLIIDEAHQFEDAVTNGLSFRLDRATLDRRLADLGSPSRGLLGDLLNSLDGHAPEKEVKKLRNFVRNLSEATAPMTVHIDTLFKNIYGFFADTQSPQSNDFVSLLLMNEQHRSRTSFAPVQALWNTLGEFFEVLSQALTHLTEALSRIATYNIPGYDDLMNSTASAARYLNEARQQLYGFIISPDPNIIYWIGVGQSGAEGVSVNAAPLHIGPIVEQKIWREKEAVVLTSATLRTQDSFDFIRERLYAENTETIEVGSPFDYQTSTLLYVPEDIPEPTNRQAYQQSVERGIIELAAALNGRVLALFTSYSQLRQTAQAITPRLALGNITVYDQSDGSSRQALVEGFKSAEKAVLLGTKSFWEGVDIPGSALSALVIVRLPFAVPTDPIFAARSQTYANSFNQYAIPDAILRFRQGFGRLIRTATDRGVVTVFDSRVITKSYGSSFLEALPGCTTQFGPLSLLPEAAKNWLNKAST